jgi:hypothetical protein
MAQFQISSPIVIRYGYDKLNGLFLQAEDARLQVKEEGSNEANKIAMEFSTSSADGGGGYFDLHTGVNGFGLRVSEDVMVEYFRRFEVPENKISQLVALNANYSVDVEGKLKFLRTIEEKFGTKFGAILRENKCGAILCEKNGNLRCSACNKQLYCSVKCQKADWKNHKAKCRTISNKTKKKLPQT